MTSPSETALEIRDVSASYGGAPVLEDLSLQVRAGELVAVLGPSGCGKTTLLRIVAGLLKPVRGEILLNGEPMNGVPAERRGTGMVFQKPLLFPHLTVWENVAFGLRMRKRPATERRRRVEEVLRLVRLPEFGSRLPRELSGGQEQRVALARALVTEPRILLLDEPFTALDENLRVEMRGLVKEIHRRLAITAVFVTHDQNEASILADRIALLFGGRMEQVGAPREFYMEPRTLRAARFFGWVSVPGSDPRGVTVVRPESLLLKPARAALPEGCDALASGEIEEITDLGARRYVRVTLASGESLALELTERNLAGMAPGQQIRICASRADWKRFSRNNGQAL